MKGRSLSFDPPSITLALELRAFLKGKKSDLGVGLKQGAWQRLLAVLRKAATRCPRACRAKDLHERGLEQTQRIFTRRRVTTEEVRV